MDPAVTPNSPRKLICFIQAGRRLSVCLLVVLRSLEPDKSTSGENHDDGHRVKLAKFELASFDLKYI